MRALIAFAMLLLIPATAAQDDDPETNCTQADPCPWMLDVDDDGFQDNSFDGPSFNATQGDWVRLEVFNFGDVTHTITFEAHGEWTVGSLDEVVTEPMQLASEGSFAIIDQPTGDEVPVEVFLSDASEDGEPITDVPGETTGSPATTPTDDAEDGPAAGLVFITLGVFAILAAMRRH